MRISKELINYVADGDLHTQMENKEHSTNIREIVTVGYMTENPVEDIEMADAPTPAR